MKLYTEEQVNKIIELARFTYTSEDNILTSFTPIELPSDEEIEEASGYVYPYKQQLAFIEGAKWYREQLKQRQ